MATAEGKTARPPAESPPPLPLENGDLLDRVEFERRYDAMPRVNKAELIEGVVHMPSPVNHEFHGKPHFWTMGLLIPYWTGTPGVDGGDNSSLRLDLDNMPQPDAFLYILPEHGGQARIADDGFLVGAPELILEVASSSVSYDLHGKLDAYRRNGVREYVVWRVRERVISWFALRGGSYEPLPMGDDGIYRSEVLRGLWLDPEHLKRGDRAGLFATVQRGLATPEHAEFVARLAATRPAKG